MHEPLLAHQKQQYQPHLAHQKRMHQPHLADKKTPQPWQKSTPHPPLPTSTAHCNAATRSSIVSVTAYNRRISSSTPTKASLPASRPKPEPLSKTSRSRSKLSMPTLPNSPTGKPVSRRTPPLASISPNSTATSASSASVLLPIRFPPSISALPPSALPSPQPLSTASSSPNSPKQQNLPNNFKHIVRIIAPYHIVPNHCSFVNCVGIRQCPTLRIHAQLFPFRRMPMTSHHPFSVHCVGI